MLLKPSVTLIYIKGNMVKNAINTGTVFGVNHIRAKSIIATTGVALNVTTIGFIQAARELYIPARIPSPTPKIAAITKPIKPRNMVAPMILRNSAVQMIFTVEISVSSGLGSMKPDLKYSDRTFHIASITSTEIKPVKVFFLEEFFITII